MKGQHVPVLPETEPSVYLYINLERGMLLREREYGVQRFLRAVMHDQCTHLRQWPPRLRFEPTGSASKAHYKNESRKRVSGLLYRNFRFRSPVSLNPGEWIQKLNCLTDSNVWQNVEWPVEYSNRRISWKLHWLCYWYYPCQRVPCNPGGWKPGIWSL